MATEPKTDTGPANEEEDDAPRQRPAPSAIATSGRGRSVVESIRADGGAAGFIAVALRDESSARSLATGALDIAGRVDL